MRLIDADRMAVDELAAFISAQAKIADAANRDINSIVHAKIQRLIADTPTVENAAQGIPNINEPMCIPITNIIFERGSDNETD